MRDWDSVPRTRGGGRGWGVRSSGLRGRGWPGGRPEDRPGGRVGSRPHLLMGGWLSAPSRF